MSVVWVHRVLIVPAELAVMARTLCETLEPKAGKNMFTTPLTNDGINITHYISSGPIDVQLATLLDNPEMLAAATGADLAQVQALLEASIISEEVPEIVLIENNLSLFAEEQIV